MTKSRRPLHLLAPLLFYWPDGAPAQSASTATAEELVAAYNGRIHDAMGSVAGARRCPRDAGGDDAIIVCGRVDDARMRLPLPVQPEPGARPRLVAGEVPSATGALSVGRACCETGGGINLLGVAAARARGGESRRNPD
jgi:hypothetical protein